MERIDGREQKIQRLGIDLIGIVQFELAGPVCFLGRPLLESAAKPFLESLSRESSKPLGRQLKVGFIKED